MLSWISFKFIVRKSNEVYSLSLEEGINVLYTTLVYFFICFMETRVWREKVSLTICIQSSQTNIDSNFSKWMRKFFLGFIWLWWEVEVVAKLQFFGSNRHYTCVWISWPLKHSTKVWVIISCNDILWIS